MTQGLSLLVGSLQGNRALFMGRTGKTGICPYCEEEEVYRVVVKAVGRCPKCRATLTTSQLTDPPKKEIAAITIAGGDKPTHVFPG